MTGITEWLALLVTLMGVLSSSVIAYLVYRSTRQAQRAEVQREISHLYDKMMDYRTEHPEVLALSRDWKESCFSSVYSQSTTEDRQWAVYYTYAELSLSFCNAVLSGHESGLLEKQAYEWQYRRLVRMVMTEHYPFLKTVLRGKYLSKYVRDFFDASQKGGWEWEFNHRQLAM